MINSINYYFSFGMLALFIDTAPTSSYGISGVGAYNQYPSGMNNTVLQDINLAWLNRTKLTFRQGFRTFDDVWDVIRIRFLLA